MSFPTTRLRRLRQSDALRRLVRETRLSPEQLVAPLFVCGGEGVRDDIAAMPGCSRMSVDVLVEECRALAAVGIPAVMLFGIPDEKDPDGVAAADPEGPVARGLAALRREVPTLSLWADVCLCEYTDHGHCGPLSETRHGGLDVDNDRALPRLVEAALAYTRAGADVVAPSDMMDGRVGAIRAGLDAEGRTDVVIVSYAAKYASAFYGPFREAAGSAPSFGDRRSYQMDPANGREALREVAADLDEGADVVMVKPALAYLDVVWRVKERFDVPVAAYNVSGEYAMVRAAGRLGWIDETRAAMESLMCIRRAGADIILTYFAKEAARLLGLSAPIALTTGTTSLDRSAALFGRACAVLPGGVNSPVRAYGAVGGTPRFLARADGAYVWDEDGQRYLDYVGAWGPMLLGHAHPAIVAAIQRQAALGHRLRRADGAGSRDGRADRRGDAVHRDGAHGQLRHRGDDGRAAAGARRHRAPAGDQVRRLLPRPRRQLSGQGRLGCGDLRHARQPRRHAGDGARHADRTVQRLGIGARAVCRLPRRDRRRHRRARGRQHGRRRRRPGASCRTSGSSARRKARCSSSTK